MLLLLLRRRLLLVGVMLLAAAAAVAQAQSRSDMAGLYSLRASLGLRARDWPLKSDPCTSWVGVACRGGRVVGVTVAGLRRTRLGALSPRLALDGLRNLTALERFNASGFVLPGAVPAWFGAALPPSLAVLDLTSAEVNGTLPADLGASGNLTEVRLAGNSISGSVPASLLVAGGGPRVLDLSRNNFTGGLPFPNGSVVVSGTGAGANASSLFNISGNSLYGLAGDAIAALGRRFQVVDVSSNYLDGALNGSSDGTVLATMNCFYGVPGQRSRSDCEEFYKKQGVGLVDGPAPSPLPSPQPSPETKKKNGISKNVLIGVLVAAGTLMVVFMAVLLLCLVKRRSRGRSVGRGIEPNEEGSGTRSVRRRDSTVNPVASSPSAVSPPRANGYPASRRVQAFLVYRNTSKFMQWCSMLGFTEFSFLYCNCRDIQASSVLLDDKYEVRLGSMSDICVQQSGGSQNVFSRILRSSKSLDKHASGPPASCSYDVLCFGKVLLELVTGNFGISGSNDGGASEEWLSSTLSRINGGDKASIADIIDPLLVVDEDHQEEVWAVAIIAKTCLSTKPSRRPSARYVLRALENPLRVVRRQGSSRSNSARLRSSSSRSSWQSVFQGNNGHHLDRRHSMRSHGSGGGEASFSFSFKRAAMATPEVATEPAAAVVEEEDAVVV
ncbi:hypothetical protein HU200_016311 [Digitaria exilis]|uniref:Leucine-rich repeat-containing N-terminal plant-type domain-containing protein n=1 Tax=Digitaria exilis TaxID=1010633 RepID=A0A835KI23_9POAL|nr:hypothetical protein HU200_016311 [Digitaria exilis]